MSLGRTHQHDATSPQMKILFDLGGQTSWLNSSRILAINLKVLLGALTTVNQVFLKKYKVPRLYESGVRYRPEPEGHMVFHPKHPEKQIDRAFAERMSGGVEDFATIPAVLARGFGDCDDLAPWLCAELRESGERATIAVKWKRIRGVKLFHIVVRRPNGAIEDPSKRLGMLEPAWKNPRLYM